MILGNPNAGKTSLFNALTNENKSVANWSGVTVGAYESTLSFSPEHQLIDLPGFYSLSAGQLTGLEMQFAAQQLLEQAPDLILNVINATQLERQLLLTSQLLELNIPIVIVVTHIDILHESGRDLNTQKLSELLGVPVLSVSNYKKNTMRQLNLDILNTYNLKANPQIMSWPAALKDFVDMSTLPSQKLFSLRRLLESGELHNQHNNISDEFYEHYFSEDFIAKIKLELQNGIDYELEMMDARYRFIHEICQTVLPRLETKRQKWTVKLDKILLNRYLGWPIFLSILWVFFTLAVDVGGALQQELTTASDLFFNQIVNHWLMRHHFFTWVQWIIVHGLGQGVSTMLSFLPVMASMNLFLSLLESSGYMARVAFLFERIMRKIGLPGKAFLPLLIGFGCNVPAIMTARIVEGSRERLLTVLLSPFMSCSARLTIYAVFASLFFPQSGGWIVLSLYLLGVIMAILTGYILRRFWLTGKALPLMIELPMYQTPNVRRLLRDVVLRLKLFIIRSGKVVIPFCMVLGSLQAALQSGMHITQSLEFMLWNLWYYGLHPILAPLGIGLDNWPAAVGLLTGTMAKEIVIATLNTLYSELPHLTAMANQVTIPEVHSGLFGHLLNVSDASMSVVSTRNFVWAFGTARAAYAYLLFVLLYIPCISTMAIIRQEVGRFWQWFALIWSFVLAYSVSSLFYQISTLGEHPVQSSLWCVGMFIVWNIIVLFFKKWRPEHVGRY
jgi:ferrous iron transport protein B